ncbi:MAG: type I methionyl aminopeptidase [Myxococcota bacterium]
MRRHRSRQRSIAPWIALKASLFRMIERLDIRAQRRLRRAGEVAAAVLDEVGKQVAPGVSTGELDVCAREAIARHGARSSQYGYQGFTGHLCTSRNDVVCHGIPSRDEVLADGDVINLDITVEVDGFHGDTSRTFKVGKVSPETERLIAATVEALMAGIGAVRDGSRVGDIGAAIMEVAERHRVSVVREYCGHGIGRRMHMDPQIPHVGRAGRGPRLREGMAFTIEPMLNRGGRECRVDPDGWTVRTADGAWSTQFEHTILVTPTGAEIMTPWP